MEPSLEPLEEGGGLAILAEPAERRAGIGSAESQAGTPEREEEPLQAGLLSRRELLPDRRLDQGADLAGQRGPRCGHGGMPATRSTEPPPEGPEEGDCPQDGPG